MKIGLIGNYGATNVGDDAILAALLNEFKGHRFTIFSAQPEAWTASAKTKNVPLFPLGFRSFFKYRFKQSKEALKKVDVVILGGGGLFQDKRLYACFLWAWQVFWVKWFKKPLFIYATGVGPLGTRMGRFLTRYAYRYARLIAVRDEDSATCLKRLGLKKEIIVVADPAFLNSKPEKAEFRTKKLFMISLRPWLHQNRKIIQSFGDFLEALKKERGAELVFVCMQTHREDDLQLIRPLVSRVGGRIFVPGSFSELLKEMEKAEFAIGMRYHFMIAALIAQTPLIPVSYTDKTTSLFQGTPLEAHLLHVEDFNETSLSTTLKEVSIAYNNTVVYQHALAKHLAEKAEEGILLLKEALKTFDQKKSK